MFDQLNQKISGIFSRLTKKGRLTEDDVNEAMREIRIALLEADVALSVVRRFIEDVKTKAIGQEVLRSITPGQMIIKIVHEALVNLLKGDFDKTPELRIQGKPPLVYLMVGLQGSGKTTTTAKLAYKLKNTMDKRVLLVSLDTYRPAAQEQLQTLGASIEVDCFPINTARTPVDIAKRAFMEAKNKAYDIIIFDTAGRLSIDEALMQELQQVAHIVQPIETILVVDSLTGQDALHTAENFQKALPLTGVILTRLDGDARGGAALSMRALTQCPIYFVGVGEKVTALDKFYPERMAERILGMGDVVSLVEKAAEIIKEEDAEKLAKKMAAGLFDLNDFLQQLQSLQKMGGVNQILNMLPGMGNIKDKLAGKNLDNSIFKKNEAIILSMTKLERKNPQLIKASRKKRIALGSGTHVQDVNKLLKQFQDMSTMMKRMGKMDKKNIMRQGIKGLLPNRL